MTALEFLNESLQVALLSGCFVFQALRAPQMPSGGLFVTSDKLSEVVRTICPICNFTDQVSKVPDFIFIF